MGFKMGFCLNGSESECRVGFDACHPTLHPKTHLLPTLAPVQGIDKRMFKPTLMGVEIVL